VVLDGSHRRHRERGDGLARRSRSPSAARRPTPDRRPAGVAGGYGDVVVSISPGRGGGGYADVVVSSPADEASWVQQQVGSLISIWSKSSNCSVRASVCGLRGSRVVVEYELPARGPVEKEITVEKLRTLLADEQAGAAASLQTDRREEQRLRLLEEERRREVAYKTALRAQQEREIETQVSHEKVQLETDGYEDREAMMTRYEQVEHYEEERWQLRQIGTIVWINSRSSGGLVQARVAYNTRTFLALYEVGGVPRQKELSPRALRQLMAEQAGGGEGDSASEATRYRASVTSTMHGAFTPDARGSPAGHGSRGWGNDAALVPYDPAPVRSGGDQPRAAIELTSFFVDHGLGHYLHTLIQDHGCRYLDDLIRMNDVQLREVKSLMRLPAEQRRFDAAMRSLRPHSVSAAVGECGGGGTETEADSQSPPSRMKASTFLDLHGLGDYEVGLFRAHGCRFVEDFTSMSEFDLSKLADAAQMLPADKRRFLNAVAEKLGDEFFERFGLKDLKSLPFTNLQDLMNATEQELHSFLSAVNDGIKQRQIQDALDQLRPCPQAAMVQQLQAQALGVGELQRRAMAYVDSGHAEVSAMMEVQGDTQGLMELIATAEKAKQQRQREQERVQVAQAAQQAQAKEHAEAARQAQQAHAEMEESELQKAVTKMENALVKHKGPKIEEDSMGVYAVEFERAVQLPSQMPEMVTCTEDSETDWHRQLCLLGITSIALEAIVPEGSGAGLVEGLARTAAGAAAAAAGTAAGAAAAGTGIGAAVAPMAGGAAQTAVSGALGGVLDAAFGAEGGQTKYKINFTVSQRSILAFKTKSGTFTVKCEHPVVNGEHKVYATEEIVAPKPPALVAVSRDRDYDIRQLGKLALDRERNPVTVSDWIESIGIGDSKRPPGQKKEYAKKLAEQDYDELGFLLAAKETDLDQVLDSPEIKMSKPHKTAFMRKWRQETGAIKRAVKEAYVLGLEKEDVEAALACPNPRAALQAVMNDKGTTAPKERFLRSLRGIKPEDDGKRISWFFTFEFKKYKRPDGSDSEVTIRKTYTEVTEFHKDLKQDIERWNRQYPHKLEGLQFSPPPKENLKLRTNYNDEAFLRDRADKFQAYFRQLITWEDNMKRITSTPEKQADPVAWLQFFDASAAFFSPDVSDHRAQQSASSQSQGDTSVMGALQGLGGQLTQQVVAAGQEHVTQALQGQLDSVTPAPGGDDKAAQPEPEPEPEPQGS
jgi:hypothetical protein